MPRCTVWSCPRRATVQVQVYLGYLWQSGEHPDPVTQGPMCERHTRRLELRLPTAYDIVVTPA